MKYVIDYLCIGFGFMLAELNIERRALSAIVKYKPVSIPIAAIFVMVIWPIIVIDRFWRLKW